MKKKKNAPQTDEAKARVEIFLQGNVNLEVHRDEKAENREQYTQCNSYDAVIKLLLNRVKRNMPNSYVRPISLMVLILSAFVIWGSEIVWLVTANIGTRKVAFTVTFVGILIGFLSAWCAKSKRKELIRFQAESVTIVNRLLESDSIQKVLDLKYMTHILERTFQNWHSTVSSAVTSLVVSPLIVQVYKIGGTSKTLLRSTIVNHLVTLMFILVFAVIIWFFGHVIIEEMVVGNAAAGSIVLNALHQIQFEHLPNRTNALITDSQVSRN